MSRRPRRNHTPALKAKVALAAIKGDRTLAQLAEQFDVHPNQITSWKAQLEGGAADVFGPGSGNGAAHPVVDVKSLHAKIGELTLDPHVASRHLLVVSVVEGECLLQRKQVLGAVATGERLLDLLNTGVAPIVA
jgi:transposase